MLTLFKYLSNLTLRFLPIKNISKLLTNGWQIKHRKRCQDNSIRNKSYFLNCQQFSDVDLEKNAADDYLRTNTNEKISCTNNNNNNHTSFQFNDDYNFSLPTKKDSKQAVKSKKSVACRVSVVLVSSLLVIFTLSTVTLVWYYMGWIYGVQAIVVAIIAVLGASGIWRLFGHWLYIAAVTGPRDLRWVEVIEVQSKFIYFIKLNLLCEPNVQRLFYYVTFFENILFYNSECVRDP